MPLDVAPGFAWNSPVRGETNPAITEGAWGAGPGPGTSKGKWQLGASETGWEVGMDEEPATTVVLDPADRPAKSGVPQPTPTTTNSAARPAAATQHSNRGDAFRGCPGAMADPGPRRMTSLTLSVCLKGGAYILDSARCHRVGG